MLAVLNESETPYKIVER